MNSLKQVIINAVSKVSTDPAYGAREYASPAEARDDFIRTLIAELFPESPEFMLPSAVHASEVTVGVEVKEKKKRAPKKKEEAAAAGPVEGWGGEEVVVPAVPEVKEKKKRAPKKKEDAPATSAEESDGGSVPVAVEEKKKRAPKKKEETPAAPAEESVAVEEKKKRAPKKKEEGAAVNHPKKLNKTEENKVKSVAKELKVEADETKVLEYLNGLSAEDYAATSFEGHVRAFLAPKEVNAEEKVAKRGMLVEFKGVDYWISPDTKKVYATTGSVDEHVGHVGMLEFADMEIPDHLPEDLEEIV
jgi:hypothetical protein